MDLGYDRVRQSSPAAANERIDQRTRENILWYSRETPLEIASRVEQLDREWDLERVLTLNAAALSLTAIYFGMTKNRLWFLFPAVVSVFLAQHAIQGWCPPVELFRRLGIRTRKEIDLEKFALLDALKGKQV